MDAMEEMFTGAPQSSVPGPGQVGDQTNATVAQLIGNEPAIFGAQSTWQPQIANLDLSTMEQGVNAAGPLIGNTYANLLPTIGGATNAANTSARTAAGGDIANLGAGTVNAIKSANPGQAGLMDNLTQTAGDQLALGTQLDPNQTRQIDQTVANNWANRGLGGSNPAQLNEALDYFGAGQNLLSQRESAAGTVANADAQQYTDPAFSVLMGTSSAPGMAGNLTGTATSMGGGVAGAAATPLISPQELDSIFGTYLNADASTNIANTNTQAGAASGEIGAVGSILGSY